MKYIVSKIINNRKTVYQLSLLFGEDWNQNTKAKRLRFRR